MDGRALTGSELACLAHISRPTASEHLSKLVKARLVAVTKKRRYRYYRIASPLVASMLESIKAVAAIEVPPRHQPRSAKDDALRLARTCYDHLAGKLGVARRRARCQRLRRADAGRRRGHRRRHEFSRSGGLSAKPGRRIFCRPCLDWSERRYHLAGHVGAAICRHCLDIGWLTRERDTRAVHITAPGVGLRDTFGVEFSIN